MLPPVADRFVAGTSTEAALERVAVLEDRGIAPILNRLGEHHGDRAAADADAAAYADLIEALDGRRRAPGARDAPTGADAEGGADAAADPRPDGGLDVAVSPKPTQLGLAVGTAVFRENLERVLDAADGTPVRVWLDMEAPDTVDDTIAAFRELAPAHPDRLGICLQANLHRTEEEVRALAAVPGALRLVKGAYAPAPDEGVRDRDLVDESYRRCLESAMRRWEGLVAAATHDLALVEAADALAERYDRRYQIQMLMGVREEAQDRLAADHDVAQYVPYGDRWLRYFYRRLKERKENVAFALKALLGR
jgi:proline dehydrogenase